MTRNCLKLGGTSRIRTFHDGATAKEKRDNRLVPSHHQIVPEGALNRCRLVGQLAHLLEEIQPATARAP